VENLLDPGHAVHFRRLVQFGVYVSHGGQVDDGSPSGELPAVGKDVDWAEPLGQVHEVDRIDAERVGQKTVQYAARWGHNFPEHRDDHDCGDETRHVGNRLHRFLEPLDPYFVQHDREKNGQGEVDDQAPERENQRVAERPPERVVRQEPFEIREADPFGSPRPHSGLKAPEREDVPEHGKIPEHHEVKNRKHQH
jgi:hypothetical protein